MQINNELIKLIEDYAGSLKETANIEAVSLYHDLSIYGDDADELLMKYSQLFNVSMNNFQFKDYFPEEEDPMINMIKEVFTKRKEYRHLTIGDLQKGIEKQKIQ